MWEAQKERQQHPEQIEPCTDCPFTSKISVKREHGILIPVIRYFFFPFFSFQFIFLLTGPPRLAMAILRASLL